MLCEKGAVEYLNERQIYSVIKSYTFKIMPSIDKPFLPQFPSPGPGVHKCSVGD